MKLHINKNNALTVIKGEVVYELPITGVAAMNVMAINSVEPTTTEQHYAQRAVRDLLNAVTTSCKVGNRRELESVDSPIMRVWTGLPRINTRSYI